MSLPIHTGLGRVAFFIFTLAAPGFVLCGESRLAILVGIDNYNPDSSTQVQILRDLKPSTVKRPVVEGDAKYWRFDNLDGAVNDVRLMKAVLQSLGFQDFVVLTDQDATADAILQTLQKNLVDDARPGDLRLFYYSGHGNHVKNRASTEQQQEDQTLVPADNWRNVPDIRDKEISRLLFQAARKGVIVTLIADSCHSGSLARGAWNSSGKVRTNSGTRAGTPGVTLHEPVANDPADIDPATRQPIDPERLGVLTLAAAQPNQEAREVQTEDGPHGAFTWALAQALRYASEPMDRIFARTMAALGANGAIQQPAMGGPSRFSQTILGQPPGVGGGLAVVVDSVKGADIRLRGGAAIGLFPRCRLKTVSHPAVTVEIASSEGLAVSIAHVVGQGSVKPGDILALERWVVPAKAGLVVSIPKPAPATAVERAGTEFGKLRGDPAIEWLDDPTAGAPTHVVSWNGSAWILETNPATKPSILGAEPTAADLKRLLPAQARLLVRLPPTTNLLTAIPLGDPDHSAVETTSTPAGAQYWLWGRISASGPVYAWLLLDSGEASARDAAGQNNHASGYLPLPIRSDWVKLPQDMEGARTAGAELTRMALLLARIRTWLTLQSPPSQQTFPYRLAFRHVEDGRLGEFKDAGDFKEGEQYKLYLRADPSALAAGGALAPRWVYVFVIDHFGDGTRVFPPPERGNEGNRLPYAQVGDKPDFQPLIPLSGESRDADFEIGPPFGVDTYFLLTSDNPIDNPEVLHFEGVRTEAGTRDTSDPLTSLLSSASSMTRGVNLRPVPALWSIESRTFRSVPNDAKK
ncbi:MAG: caspase family protein [Bryobacteraceae bacterium]